MIGDLRGLLAQGVANAQQQNNFNQRARNLAAAQGLGQFDGALIGYTGNDRTLRTPDEITFRPREPKTIREELQTETNKWLKDTV